MATAEHIDRKTTKNLYRKIYRARLDGHSHASLREIFNCSQSTIERAINFGNNFYREIPVDSTLIKNQIEDYLSQRASLRDDFREAENKSDKVKLSKSIIELDEKILILINMLARQLGSEDNTGIMSDSEILDFIDKNRNIIKPESPEGDGNALP